MAKRHPPRLHASVYRGPAQYFLTMCCYRRRKLFDGAAARGLVESELCRTSEAMQFAIIAYCLMPDHLHVVCEALSDESDLQAFVQLFKQRAAYAWKQKTGEPLWQSSYYDHVLRDSESTRSVVRYTLENPVRAHLVDEPRQYPHIGSFVYGHDEFDRVGVRVEPGGSMREERQGLKALPYDDPADRDRPMMNVAQGL